MSPQLFVCSPTATQLLSFSSKRPARQVADPQGRSCHAHQLVLALHCYHRWAARGLATSNVTTGPHGGAVNHSDERGARCQAATSGPAEPTLTGHLVHPLRAMDSGIQAAWSTSSQRNNNNNNHNNTSRRTLLEVKKLFKVCMAVMRSWIYTYLQTHRVVRIKYVQLFVCQSHLNEVKKKN